MPAALRQMPQQRNPATLVWNASAGPATADVYMMRLRGADRFEVDVANDRRKHTYKAASLDAAKDIARDKLREYAVQNPERVRNGLFANLFGTREYVYPNKRGRKLATGRAPAGREVRYLGTVIRRTDDGDYANSIDWDNRFDTLNDAKAFVKAWQKRNKNSRTRNPEASAAALSETFHGRPAQTVDEYEDELHVHSFLTELGDLIEITVDTESGFTAELDFAKEGLKLASSEDGRQLFIQGRTKLDLAALHMNGNKWERDHMVIGRITALVYCTAKEYDGGKRAEYIHESGEENIGGKHKRTTKVFPILLYDTRNEELQIAGGQQEVQDVGIIR